jgi:hypothetical protein
VPFPNGILYFWTDHSKRQRIMKECFPLSLLMQSEFNYMLHHGNFKGRHPYHEVFIAWGFTLTAYVQVTCKVSMYSLSFTPYPLFQWSLQRKEILLKLSI